MADQGWISHKNPLTLLNQLIKPVVSVGADGEARVNIELDLKGGTIKNVADVRTEFVNGSEPETLDLSGELYILDQNHNVRVDGPFYEFPADASYNVAVGYDAGGPESTGSRNVFLGPYAGKGVTQSDVLRITNANELDRPPLIAGDFANGRVGINKTNPTAALEVAGEVAKVTNMTGTTTQFQLTGMQSTTGTFQSSYVENVADASGGNMRLRVSDAATGAIITGMQIFPDQKVGVLCGSTKPTAGFEVGSGVSTKLGGALNVAGDMYALGDLWANKDILVAGRVGINTGLSTTHRITVRGGVSTDTLSVEDLSSERVVVHDSLTAKTVVVNETTTLQADVRVGGDLRVCRIKPDPLQDPSRIFVECEQLNVPTVYGTTALKGESLVIGKDGAYFGSVVQSTHGIIAPTPDVLNSSDLLANVKAMYTAMANFSRLLTVPSHSYSVRTASGTSTGQTAAQYTMDGISSVVVLRFFFRAYTNARTPSFLFQFPGTATIFRSRTPCKRIQTQITTTDPNGNGEVIADGDEVPERIAHGTLSSVNSLPEPPFVHLPYEYLIVIRRTVPDTNHSVTLLGDNGVVLPMSPNVLSDPFSDAPTDAITWFPFNV